MVVRMSVTKSRILPAPARCLRLMSYLCPDRRGVDCSIGRALARNEYPNGRLPGLRRTPSSKLELEPVAVRFAFARRSVAVDTETLGLQRATATVSH